MGTRSEKIQKVILVALSILLSFFLWLYVMGEENPIKTKSLNVPVTLINLDAVKKSNLVLIPDQHFNLDVTLTGRTFDLSKVTSGDLKVEGDMNAALKKGTNNIPIKITLSQSRITATLKNNSNFIAVKLDALEDKMVPVIINIVGNVKDGYGYTNPVARPEQVLISGPSNYVNSVTQVTGDINVRDKNTLVNASIAVVPRDKNGVELTNINCTPAYINGTVSIKPSKEVPIKLNTFGAVQDNKYLSSIKPEMDHVVIIGDDKYLSKISEVNTATLDLSKITHSGSVRLNLNLPMGVSIMDSSNSNVKVVIAMENRVEKTTECSISLNNQDPDYTYTLSTSSVKVTLRGPEKMMKTIDSNSILPVVNVASLTEGSQTVPVEVGKIDGIELKAVTPSQVLVDIVKK